ncbi:MAG: hypothetical protein ABS91_00055 [Thiobacillus sp. SCN 64-35]|uniref:hypothetical protein n=1 Tax=Thiobacillus sp. 0-1251 TaxID=1895858 RepID=UPI00086BF6E5|nr:hypothetical protein [Thiobacillus sp. 0-1251]ODU14645.1 MAG: hypothetical protein ABS91_00055 [Thiobacillus sp. SCN 64-35]OJY60335.1 MAG: hypothetical protein BGP19_15930 [Thiobacillus sp. 0-1251]
MRWKKLGIVYRPDGSRPWAVTHAMVPTPLRLSRSVIRVFVTFCDQNGIGRPGYVDVSASDPTMVVAVSEAPLLDIGEPGTFDENGVLLCSVVDQGQGDWNMYYVGFELGTKIRYRLLTGLARSHNGGETFARMGRVPVLERSDRELYFRGGPCCFKERGRYRLWYVAGSEWIEVDGKPMPVYDIRYVESDDGIHWPSEGNIQIPITKSDEHGFGRPYVISKPGGGYRMFYSVRRKSFRAYRLGYAESLDGYAWTRMDEQLSLDVTPGSFDSDAIMYAAPIQIDDKLYVFYNGNDFGRDGFAVAVLEEE